MDSSICVLGAIEARSVDGQPVRLVRVGQRRLLALLATRAGHMAPAPWLGETLELQPGALRTSISRLRSLLGHDVIVTRSPGYVLESSMVDAVAFEEEVLAARDADDVSAVTSLRSALARWRGDAYEEFASEEWAQPTAVRLDNLRVDAGIQLADRLIDVEQYGEAIAMARSLTHAHPYRDGPTLRLMRALDRAGRRTEALRAFQAHRQRLIDEVGTEPGQVLVAAEREIAAGRPHAVWSGHAQGEPVLDDAGPPATALGRQLDHRSGAGSVPPRLASFVGRSGEREGLNRLIDANRLVTITGAGGAGKTSLAHRVVTSRPEFRGNGVWWLELAMLADGSEVARALTDVLGIRSTGHEQAVDAVVHRLGTDEALVVFDNCEHLVDAVAPLVAELVERCPGLRVLTTSRVSLGVPGEVSWRVPPMAVGVDSDAVALFAERAAEVGFRVRDVDRATIAAVCGALDGIPLAIELAAARTRVLSPADVLDGLTDALWLLRRQAPGTVERQRTIEASIEWSVRLLDASTVDLLDRLSAFRGGFDLAAAIAVAGPRDRSSVVDDLELLLDHSLVRPAGTGVSRGRFELLETIRQFGERRLEKRPIAGDVRRVHARHFAELARREGGRVETEHEDDAVAALDRDLPNIRVALSWLRSHDTASFATALAELAPYWTMAGASPEGIRWLTQAIEARDPAAERLQARLLALRGHMLGNIGDFKAALADGRAAVELGRETGDDWAVGRALWRLSDGLSYGDLDTWRSVADEAMDACQTSGDRFAAAYMAVWLGVPYLNRGHFRTGAAALSEAEALVRASGNPSVASSMQAWQAQAAYYAGRFEEAIELSDATLACGGFRLPLQRVFIDRLRSGASLRLGLADPVPSFRALADDLLRRGEPFAAFVALDWDPRRCLLEDPDSAVHAAQHLLLTAPGGLAACSGNTSLAWAAIAQGRVDVARHHLGLARACGTPTTWPLHAVQLTLLGAATEIGSDPEAAMVEAQRGVAETTEHGQEVHRVTALRLFALAARLAGHERVADRRATEAASLLDRMGGADVFAPVLALEHRHA